MFGRFGFQVTFAMVTLSIGTRIVPMWNALDPVGSFLADLAKALREWYAALLQSIVDIVTMVSVPPPEMLVNDFFTLALGSTYEFARVLAAIIAVVVAFVIVVSPTARHGVKVQRTLLSLLMVIVLGWVFYPLYSLLYNLSKAAVEGILALIKIDDEGPFDVAMRLFSTANVADSINTIISTGLSGTFGVFLIGIAVALFVCTIIVMIFYPLAIAVRPLGAFGSGVFNAFNAAILTTLLSPAIMAATFLFPLFIQKYMSAVAVVASPVFALVGSVLAVATPFVIFGLAFKKSSEVFGRLDDASGQFDIGRMPPVSVEEVKNDVQVTQNATASAVIADTLGDSLLYSKGGGALFDDILTKGVDLAATATAAAGHPYIGFGMKAAKSGFDAVRNQSGDDSAETPTSGGERNV